MVTREIKERLGRAQQGDTQAFAEIFESLRPKVYAISFRLVGGNDADDVVMETYLKAWKAVVAFSGRSSLTTWLYRITHNCAMDFLRTHQRRRDRLLPEDEVDGRTVEEHVDARQPEPSDQLMRAEEARLVHTALESLSYEHRISILLRYTDGLSYKDIAAATGVTIGTVMSRIFNAKRRLRKMMDKVL